MLETNRQRLSGNNAEELLRREDETQRLVHDLVGRHAEYFAEPENRIDFLQSVSPDEFYGIAQHVNAKLRGEKPQVLRGSEEEKIGGSLLLMPVPSSGNKSKAFTRGFTAVQEYLVDSPDDAATKVEKVGTAVEALVILVHPFKDGNGRTSRFLGKLIEEGGSDVEALVAETADGRKRGWPNIFKKHSTREYELMIANDEDTLLDNDEREVLRQKAEILPDEVEAAYVQVRNILHDDALREREYPDSYYLRA